MNRIAVFCGSSRGVDPEYSRQAKKLGKFLADNGITLVFGGSKVGLMEDLSEAALQAGGQVIGVMPRLLFDKGIGHPGLTEMIVEETMHDRKMRMSKLCDGIIALPGGFGTLDESFEMITWAQLGIHQKPVAFLNVKGFYDPLNNMVNHMTTQGFLKAVHRDMLIISPCIDDILQKMEEYTAPTDGKWIR
jgi:uncharacterized protein (TIGR00730 family)